MAIRQGLQSVLEAVQSGNTSDFKKHVKTLSSRGAAANLGELKDGSGRVILHHAAQQGHVAMCKHMVEELGLDINTQDNNGGHWAD